MKISYGKSDLAGYSELAAGFVFEDDLKIELENPVKGRYETLCKSKAFEGKLLQTVQLQDGGRTAIIIGLGKKGEFDAEWIRRAGALAYKAADGMKAAKLEIMLPRINGQDGEMARAAVEGAIIASYPLDRYKSDVKKERRETEVCICGKNEKEIREGMSIGKIMAESQNYVRELDERPANMVNPAAFAEEAKKLSTQYGMKIEVLGRRELEKKGMNGILAVGRGSASEPLLVSVEYTGASNAPLYSVVGKGITFDSGGISLKPAKGMQEMKYDKTGACIVLGVLKAAAELKMPVRILGVMPLAENLPSGTAGRPGDIVKMYSGKTVEILNTDAEGRLILGDALAYAAERKPAAIIDVATLTGAIIVCLGRHAIGLFTNDAKLGDKVKAAGSRTYERVWEFPLWKEYSEMVKGDFADIKNIGSESGEAGSITAAAFLKEFVGDAKWAHLDIAGVDCVAGKHPLIEKGATGTGMRLITQSIIELSRK
ncbi:cytosol aminopeptidase [uncultured archaeon]|nr:cytosol aminopeptidase [uncultured archaeon]